MDLDEFLSSSEFCMTLNETKEDPRNKEFDGKVIEPNNQFNGSPQLPNNSQVSQTSLINGQVRPCETALLPTTNDNPLGWADAPYPTNGTANSSSFRAKPEDSYNMQNEQNCITKLKTESSPSVTASQHLPSSKKAIQNAENPISPLSNSNSLETDEGRGESVDSDEGLAQSTSSNDLDNENIDAQNESVDQNSEECSPGQSKSKNTSRKRGNSKTAKNRTGKKNSNVTSNKKRKTSLVVDLLDYNPTPVTRKPKRKSIPEELKDAKYWERREKNNVAAKRSRDMRREKECGIKVRVFELERENSKLKEKIEELKKKLASSEEKLKAKEYTRSAEKLLSGI